jgi:hypothetical protein
MIQVQHLGRPFGERFCCARQSAVEDPNLTIQPRELLGLGGGWRG